MATLKPMTSAQEVVAALVMLDFERGWTGSFGGEHRHKCWRIRQLTPSHPALACKNSLVRTDLRWRLRSLGGCEKTQQCV